MPFDSLEDLLARAVSGLFEPLAGIADPTKRTSLLFLAVAAWIAAVTWLARGRPHRSLLRFLFARRVWLHRSALLDYRLLFVRALLRATVLWPLAFSEVAVAVTLLAWLSTRVAPPSPSPLDPALVTALLSVSVFVAEDLARFLIHRAAHRVPALWELHKVHHSAEVMTPFTVQRAHPLESVIMRAGAQLAVGLTVGLFMWLFPGQLRAWQIGGVYALSFLWTMLGANLRHSQVWVSYGPWLEHVFISPAQHQIHHARRPDQFDRNYGSALAIWDWLAGSLVVTTARRPRLRFGLPEGLKNHEDTVVSVLVDPLVAAVRTLRRR
jgi:sterol desaturase/sphingolipid hydroxylase (fatty acid hydroxylase superfamily)